MLKRNQEQTTYFHKMRSYLACHTCGLIQRHTGCSVETVMALPVAWLTCLHHRQPFSTKSWKKRADVCTHVNSAWVIVGWLIHGSSQSPHVPRPCWICSVEGARLQLRLNRKRKIGENFTHTSNWKPKCNYMNFYVLLTDGWWGGCTENISISSAVCRKTVKQNQTHVVLAVGPNARTHALTHTS